MLRATNLSSNIEESIPHRGTVSEKSAAAFDEFSKAPERQQAHPNRIIQNHG
jgi:hypothetical protein